MIVAGFGFRSGATLGALQEALAKAGGPSGVTHLATLSAKAEGLRPLALALDLPVVALEAELLRGIPTPTRSSRVVAMFGTGSISEAAALAAAGEGACLRGPRSVSSDGTATAAIAEGLG
ncbi:MAG: cobalamin biosynthesis protein [Tabrizicola sp.]|uniref:cobalamin biosynthesis protein n=1 Tax=Tabrizicola sp. TaxID=2005166 RepID=UPI00273716DC|nr:cobalamin biosynthesis protein [Tabrizicola sp.]MDP3261965.1 cobalamin biosynthesis protein [Tabrizicola sp.]